MNTWMWAGSGLLVCVALCAPACLRGDAMSRLVGLELASTFATLAFAALSVGLSAPLMLDVALAAAMLSFGGGLVFARFLESRV